MGATRMEWREAVWVAGIEWRSECWKRARLERLAAWVAARMRRGECGAEMMARMVGWSEEV